MRDSTAIILALTIGSLALLITFVALVYLVNHFSWLALISSFGFAILTVIAGVFDKRIDKHYEKKKMKKQ